MSTKRYFRVKRYPAFAKFMAARAIRGVARRITTAKERHAVQSAIPGLSRFDELAKTKRAQLAPYYEAYVSQVSTADMAISLELATFEMVVCELLKPKSILDLGSGFSSLVFRVYESNADLKPIVCSVDDSQEWLDKTAEFLTSYGFSSGNLINWREFAGHEARESYDLISYDLGNMRVREDSLKEVLLRGHSGSVILLDDMHKDGYRSYVQQMLNGLNLDYFNLRYFTGDRYGRYSVLLIMKSNGAW